GALADRAARENDAGVRGRPSSPPRTDGRAPAVAADQLRLDRNPQAEAHEAPLTALAGGRNATSSTGVVRKTPRKRRCPGTTRGTAGSQPLDAISRRPRGGTLSHHAPPSARVRT